MDATLQGRHYVEETILPRRDDPLRWWRDQEKHYTLLSIVALKYLSIPGNFQIYIEVESVIRDPLPMAYHDDHSGQQNASET